MYLSFTDEQKKLIGTITVTFELKQSNLDQVEKLAANPKKQDKYENPDTGK